MHCRKKLKNVWKIVSGISSLVVAFSLFDTEVYAEDNNIKEEIKLAVDKQSFKYLEDNKSYEIETLMWDKGEYSRVYETASELQRQQEEEEELHKEWLAMNGRGLIGIDNPDPRYDGSIIKLDDANRDLLERLVQGEAGGEGVAGAALVAQCLHDTMLKDNNYDVANIIVGYKYTGDTSRPAGADAKEAVSIVFDQGGYAVKHRIIYFYAPDLCSSPWHETQNFVVEYGGHRVFDRR